MRGSLVGCSRIQFKVLVFLSEVLKNTVFPLFVQGFGPLEGTPGVPEPLRMDPGRSILSSFGIPRQRRKVTNSGNRNLATRHRYVSMTPLAWRWFCQLACVPGWAGGVTRSVKNLYYHRLDASLAPWKTTREYTFNQYVSHGCV